MSKRAYAGIILAMAALCLVAGGAGAVLSSIPREDTWVADGPVNAIVATPTITYIGGAFTHVGPCTGGGAPIDTGMGTLVAANLKVHGAVYASIADGTGGWYIGGDFTQVGTVIRNNIAHILSDGTVDGTWNPNADNQVNALAVSGTTVYVGGWFTTIDGQTRNHIVALDATTGEVTAWNPNANGTINALVVSDTTVYAGGGFTTIGGQTRNRLAALDAATGLATAWNPNADNIVLALAVSETTVYAGGEFATIGGQTRNRLAALDATTGLPTAWNPNANATVRALAVSGSTVYAGGDFVYVGGQARNYIAALDATTGLATAWDPDVADLGGLVYALAVSGTTVYAGGDFEYIGGWRRHNIAALNTATGLATAWNPGVGGDGVRALAVSGTTVYAGGEFATIGGQMRNHIAALDATTGTVTAWNPNANADVAALAVSGTTMYAGGYFSTIGGQSRNCIAALSTTTGQATAWNPDADGGTGPYPSVNALAVSGTTVYAGGNFGHVGVLARNHIAAINTTTGTATSWNPNVGGANPEYPEYPSVCALAVSGTTVYAGGYFTTVGGQTRNHIAAIDATSGAPTTWNPNASSPYPDPYTSINALAVSGTTVYAGGAFTTIGGQTRYSIAALNATTGLATTWSPGADGSVNALTISGTTAYTGGRFESIGGQTRLYIAALNTATAAATTWNPNPGSGYPDPQRVSKPIFAFSVSGTTVYAGGDFVTIGGLARPYFAEFRNVVSAPGAPGTPGATAICTNKITWTWTDNSSDESGFKVYDDPGAGPPTTLQTTTPPGIMALTRTGLNTNAQYAFQVAATNVIGNSAKTANFTAWTLAAGPVAPTVGNPTGSTLDVTTGAGDGNPAYTEYAFYCTTTGQWVQAGGAPGADAAWQTAPVWGTTTVTGLADSTSYAFSVTARNGAGMPTVAGPPASGTTLDATPPTGTVVINSGAAFTNVAAVILTLSANDGAGSGVTDMQFSNDGTGWSGWERYGTSKSWALESVTDGLKTVHVQYRDAAGNVSMDTMNATITLDTTSPTGSIVINEDIAVTSSLDVLLTLSADDGTGSGVTKMQFSNDGTDWSAAEPYDTGKTWTLAAGADGPRTVHVRYKDALENWSGSFSDTITLDTSLPAGTVSIDSGAAFTNTLSATLSLSANTSAGTITQMQFSNDGTGWSVAEAYGTSKAWMLAAGADGPRSVFVMYKSSLGVWSPAIPGMIGFDTTPPTGTLTINGGAAFTNVAAVTLTLSADDGAGSGVADMQFSNDGSTWSGWETYGTSKVWTLESAADGPKTAYVQYRDAMGNVSTGVVDASITLDTAPPTGHLSINGFDPATNDPNVALNIWGDDGSGSGIDQMRFSENGTDWTVWKPMAGSLGFLLTGADGTKTVYLEVMDGAGNVSTPDAASILLDTIPPSAVIALTTPSPTTADAVVFTVSFSEPLGTSFNDTTVSVAGTLSGTVMVSGTDPDYTVAVTLADPNADGTIGITVPGGAVTDIVGNAYAGGSSALCTVHNWPGFAAQPQGARLYVGDSHVLSVQLAEGGILTAYQWKFDRGTSALPENGPPAPEWSLTEATMATAGDYWCEVVFDGVMHASDTVTIEAQPRISISTPPVAADAVAGGSHRFTVAATGGYGPLSYQWKKAGENISGANGTEYTRANLAIGDSGEYSVEISDTNGDSVESVPVTLTVFPAVPVAGLGALALLAAAMAVGIRRKRRAKSA